MITGILFQILQLYRICKFATETTVLDVILPHITPDEYFDDRLADTLDAIFDYGIGNLETVAEFEFIVSGDVPMPDGNISGFISDLNPLQKDILSILEVPMECYSYEHMFDTS